MTSSDGYTAVSVPQRALLLIEETNMYTHNNNKIKYFLNATWWLYHKQRDFITNKCAQHSAKGECYRDRDSWQQGQPFQQGKKTLELSIYLFFNIKFWFSMLDMVYIGRVSANIFENIRGGWEQLSDLDNLTSWTTLPKVGFLLKQDQPWEANSPQVWTS